MSRGDWVYLGPLDDTARLREKLEEHAERETAKALRMVRRNLEADPDFPPRLIDEALEKSEPAIRQAHAQQINRILTRRVH